MFGKTVLRAFGPKGRELLFVCMSYFEGRTQKFLKTRSSGKYSNLRSIE
jgi:hypothetical protein